jgi:exonuclease SbcC
MHIARVELENIKSYRRAEFAFERGTTAIMGRNGAGKTTIIEAIAWALFDTLDYNKDDFLRRGARKGSVRVTFESDLDGRQYTVYRDTGQGYYVHDPALNMRIAERKTDVLAFLRMHLGIEPGMDMKALYKSAIGVPQGSFTAIFSEVSKARKAAFDPLLKVEEYREGAERLRDAVHLIRERAACVRERIAGAEGQLARYDELVSEHEAAHDAAQKLGAALEELQSEAQARALVVDELEAAEKRAQEARAELDRLAAQSAAAQARLQAAERELEAATRALERQQATAREHEEHLAALDLLRRLETDRAARDRLRERLAALASQAAAAEGDVRRLEEALAAALRAGEAVAALEEKVREQEELERERDRLRDLRAQAVAAQARAAQLDAELKTLRKQHAETKQRIAEAEAARGAQAQVEKLEIERLQVETDLAREREALTSRAHLVNARRAEAREIERLRSSIAALEKETALEAALSQQAAQVADLERREREIAHTIARLGAEIARDERMRAEIKGGLCPILSQRCLNLAEGQTLDGYFTDQLTANRAAVESSEAERAKITAALRAAREAEKSLARLDEARRSLSRDRDLLAEHEATLAEIDRTLATLPADQKRRRELEIQLGSLDLELKAARDVARRAAELDSARRRLKEIEAEGKRKRDEHAEKTAAAAGLGTLETDIQQVEMRLRALEDPRGQRARMRAEAARAASIRIDVEDARKRWQALEDEMREARARVERFSQLDAVWQEATATRERTIEAHREHLASRALAETLPARRAEFAQSAAEAERLARETEAVSARAAQAAALYDRDRHVRERAALAAVRERAAAVGAQAAAALERAAALRAEIDRLAKVRESLKEEFRAKEKLDRMAEATDFIRDVLKQAGPEVTRSYLYNVSVEANQLFREITGESGRTLQWTGDYEIVLEEDGYERAFPSLSGGEQMAAALAVRLALLKQLSDIRIAFFDEPTVNMDAERRERLAQAIGQIRNFDQLFVISHDDAFEESVDHTVHVEREGLEAA